VVVLVLEFFGTSAALVASSVQASSPHGKAFASQSEDVFFYHLSLVGSAKHGFCSGAPRENAFASIVP
jgi:hypothetical protein